MYCLRSNADAVVSPRRFQLVRMFAVVQANAYSRSRKRNSTPNKQGRRAGSWSLSYCRLAESDFLGGEQGTGKRLEIVTD